MYHKGEEKMGVSILLDGVDAYIKEEDLKECSQKASQIQKKLLEDKDESRVLGWRTLEESAVGLDVMRKKAEEIRKMLVLAARTRQRGL